MPPPKIAPRKLRPLTINSNQVMRMFRQPIGSGFICFRQGEEAVDVVEFVKSDDGRLLRTDGTPLTYTCNNGRVVTYTVVETPGS